LDLRKRPFEWLYRVFLKSARRDERECDLTYAEFVLFTKVSECFYCARPISWMEFTPSSTAAKKGGAYNLDRMDASKGYIKGNVVVCCPRCNWGKSDRFSFKEWVVMTRALRELEV